MAYITNSDVKNFLGIADNNSDALLANLATRAEKQLNSIVCLRFDSHEVNEAFPGDGKNKFFPASLPFAFTDSHVIKIDGIADLGEDDVNIYSDDGYIELKTKTFTTGKKCEVSYTAGFETVPEDVKQAAIEIAAFLFQRAKSVGIKSESDGPINITYETIQLEELPSVKVLVQKYKPLIFV